jgi:hypothetical protein
MLILGVLVLIQKSITGWKKFAPLLFGTWFPFSMLLVALTSEQPFPIHSIELYNLFVYACLALMVRSIADPSPVRKEVFVKWNF